MRRIYNYIAFKISSTKSFVFCTILVIYQFSLLINLISKPLPYNIYDFVLENFSYLSLFFTINLFFLVMIYNIFDKKNFYNYLSIRFSSKQEIYRGNVFFAFVFSIGIVIFITIISILLGSFMSFHNSWSSYFFHQMTGNINLSYSNETIKLIVQKLTPISFVFITSLFTALYLFFIAMFFIVCNIIFKKRVVSLILVILLNALSKAFDSFGTIAKFSFSKNIYIVTSSAYEVTNNTYILFRLAYWITLIILMYFIGNILTKKKDCSYGD